VNQLISNKQYDTQTLNNLSRRVMNRWEDLLQQLDITDYYQNHNYITSICPIHNGDNNTALNLYINESNGYPPGMWSCNSHNCQDVFGKGIIGLTRGILSQQKLGWSAPKDKIVSFEHSVNYLLNFLKTDYLSLKSSGQNGNQLFTQQINNIFARPNTINPYNITRDSVRAKLDIPAQYYLDRGYSSIILSAYDIGLCTDPSKMMYNRVVIPIYDGDYNYVGCTGRSIFEKCEKCKQYHNPQKECSDRRYPKYLHSSGFQKTAHLYNYCNAKEYIKKSQTAILVEGPSDIFRLEEAGLHNGVATLGLSLSFQQLQLLNSSGALSLVVVFDNDDNQSGQNAMKKIQAQLSRLYRLYFPTIAQNDVGDMRIDEITSDILPYINKIKKEMI